MCFGCTLSCLDGAVLSSHHPSSQQVKGNGFATGTGPVTVLSGGLTVAAGGLSASGNVALGGKLSLLAGTVSVTSTHVTNTLIDVFPSVAGFAANAIVGRIAAGSSANALVAAEGGNVLFKARTRVI